ncbi:SAM-dependent methyltransferase [Kibdelosporangium lantanae]|uniref:S-adenosyl-L-methionine-dependent methyltransferase n=1 Tax=Kibdelosporangium lantanae TaxID=1497396 RepID=A0ABW3M5A7_9PSEU
MSEVSRTALGVATMRAIETRRPNRLFEDPYAEAFVPLTPEKIDRANQSLFRVHIVVRTRFFDDYLLAAVKAGCQQVVLVAAGLDTRAFRLDWPEEIRLYELDLPTLLAYKEKTLGGRGAEPRADRTVVPVDLREDWPQNLVTAGFDPSVPTAWLVEGLLVYLTADEAAGVLAAVTSLSAPGSQIGCEDRDPDAPSERNPPQRANVMDLWKGGVATVEWLTEHGWQVETYEGTALAESYGREPEAPVGNFLTATRPE